MKARNDGYTHFAALEIAGDSTVAGNGVQLNGGAASSPSEVASVGDDTNVDLRLSAKGTSLVELKQSSGEILTPIVSKEVTFTETSGAGTYTGAVNVPAGATLLDIVINGVALWTNAGACTMKVGDTDDDGYYTGIDLKATDLLAGESLSFALAGGKAGAYIANSQVSPRYSATARTINGIVTTASTAGGAGRTRMTVVYALASAASLGAANKV